MGCLVIGTIVTFLLGVTLCVHVTVTDVTFILDVQPRLGGHINII